MKLVIDIDEETYTRLKTALIINAGNTFYNKILTSVAEGTPLPKGHGELIDKDTVLDMMNHGILEDYITTMGGIIPADK